MGDEEGETQGAYENPCGRYLEAQSFIPRGPLAARAVRAVPLHDERFLPPPPVLFPGESAGVDRSASMGFPSF